MPIFNSKSSSNSLQKGQTLLIIVLIMVVGLTVVLSVATRSLTNTRISSEEESSQRAFSAAEAGIERLLKTSENTPQTGNFQNNADYTAQLLPAGKSDELLNGGSTVAKDEGVDFWLSKYTEDAQGKSTYSDPRSGKYSIRWQKGDCSNGSAPAIEVVLLSGASTTTAKATHYAFDPCTNRSQVNNFGDFWRAESKTIQSSGSSVTFDTAADIDVTSGYIARIIPLYANTKIGVSRVSGDDLHPQGKSIVSTGTSNGTKRQITVFQQYPKLPIEIFPYAIFAPDNS